MGRKGGSLVSEGHQKKPPITNQLISGQDIILSYEVELPEKKNILKIVLLCSKILRTCDNKQNDSSHQTGEAHHKNSEANHQLSHVPTGREDRAYYVILSILHAACNRRRMMLSIYDNPCMMLSI